MPTEVVMPQMGESITEGTITKWLKKTGDTIQRDEPLFEISTDKVDAEIPSPAAGTLKEIKIAEGTTVQINTVVCTIEEGASASAPAAAAPAKNETAAAPAADTATPAAVDTPAATQGNPAEASIAAAGTDTAAGPGT
ncbi:MAG TPA: biotin/lipoyl-containing protein, partial [Edaphobacter sp.]|nr:biotin/lipoyl-containing protein [Edaphobacter sp.]